MSAPLSPRERAILFWASFLSLMAAGFGFAFRVARMGSYQEELQLTYLQTGQIFGATLWPIAVTMILFSLIVDRTGYKWPMYAAFALQAIAGIGTALSKSYGALYFSALCAGLGHGIIEAVINPACAAVYPKAKTKWLAILHAAWPAGLAGGTLLILLVDAIAGGEHGASWRLHALWIVLPAVAYAIMLYPCRFPVDERVQAGVPYIVMLRQVGFLGAALASFMLIFEIGNQVAALTKLALPDNWFTWSLGLGVVAGAGYGLAVRAVGKPVFFLMCVLMIPLATAELATDQWIKNLMTPVLSGIKIDPAFALVFSSAIMLVFRVFAGGVLRFFTPPSLLTVSGLFSSVGLLWLAKADGAFIFIAFVIYAMGQTFYWPCVLGFVSERYPQGGALTLNTVSALGLLSVGIIGGQLIAAAFDRSVHERTAAQIPGVVEAAEIKKQFLWESAPAIDPEKKEKYVETLAEDEKAQIKAEWKAINDEAGRDVLIYSVRFPAVLIVGFGAIYLWFRMKGGYKPIELTGSAGGSGGGGGH